jgi:hypothetical protein
MPSRIEAAVELRLGEKRAGQAQDFIILTQFPDLPFQLIDPLQFRRGCSRTLARITFVLTYPAP